MPEAVTTRPWTRRRTRRAMVHVVILAVFDMFALYEAFVVAFGIRAADEHPFLQPVTITGFAELAALLSPVWVLIFAAIGLYGVRNDRKISSELGRIVIAVALGVMVLVVIDYMRTTRPIFPGRSVPVYCLVLGVAFVFTCRMFVRLALRFVYRYRRGLHRAIIIGTNELAQRIALDLMRPHKGYEIAGVVSPAHAGRTFLGSVPVYETLEVALDDQDEAIDEVIQADVDMSRDEISRLMSYANAQSMTYRFVPDQYGVYAATSTMDTIDGIAVMEVRLTALDGWPAVGKRIFDLVGAGVVLLVASPVLLVLALLVKLRDPAGPILYGQTRIGRYGRPVRVLKFRSMFWKYSTGPGRPYATAVDVFRDLDRDDLVEEFAREHKVHDDPRVTNIGAWLRRTSLDELPQLFNVLSGRLSLIGPRPVTQDELDRYGDQRASYLALKPGVTGLWQVSGRSDVSYDERVKLDIFYIENWSMKMDAQILAKTPVAVLARRGAS